MSANVLDWTLTLIGLAAGVGFGAYASHIAGLPHDDMKPRRLPWRLFIILSAFFVVILLVHLANLVGIETGPDKSPFMRR